jgi:hypothetical protein
MIDFFLSLIEVNEGVNYAMIISFIAAYFLIIWLVICIWVFSDAKKRYPFVTSPVLFALFVLFFGPPALIFYIMIRPEHTLEEEYLMDMALGGEKEARPIYFDGDKGFEISINFSVQPKASGDGKHKMKMNVEWMPQRGEESKIKQEVIKQKSEVATKKEKGFWSEYKEWANLTWRQFKKNLSQIFNSDSRGKEGADKKKVTTKEEKQDTKGKVDQNTKDDK